LVGYYSYWLVLFSVVVAITASYVALDLTSRVAASHGLSSEPFWLAGGAAAMGCGIWSIHFICMLSFRTPFPMSYDVPTTGLSLLIAVSSSWFGLSLASRRTLSPSSLLAGGSILGFGIAAMHYTGMAATRVLPSIHYDIGLVVLSVVIALGTSIAALWSAFNLRLETILTAFWKKAGSATVMGSGICWMHYTGMAAVMFAPNSISTATPQIFGHAGLPVILGAFTLVFLLATLLLSALDAYFAERSAQQARSLRALNSELEMRSAELSRINALLQQEVQVRKQAEEALRVARDELETRVNERTAELRQSNDSLHEEISERKMAEHALRVSQQQLRRLFDEREHLVRDMHDNIVQSIYVAGLNLEEIERLIQKDPTRAAEAVASTVGDLNGVIRDIRRYIDRPAEQIGAPPLRDNLAKLIELSRPNSDPRFRLKVDATAEGQLTPDEAEHVLQIAREAMSNSRRHSHAKHGTVTLRQADDGVTLEVRDDGDGFDPAALKYEGNGLSNMKTRAQQIGARFEVVSSPGKGTRVVLHIPKGQTPK
jgi:NO-binding membrane sensor protein with MHYT domain/two-component sensor histidine kinase